MRSTSTEAEPPQKSSLDRAAVFLSGLCLVHCLAVPFALLLGPALSAWLISSETIVHWILLGIAVPISGVALWRGQRKRSGSTNFILGMTGLFIMLIAVSHLFGEAYEIGLTVIGVLMLLIAHLRNMSAGHKHA